MLHFYKQLGFDVNSTDFLEALTHDPTIKAGLDRGATLPEIIIQLYKDKKHLSEMIKKMAGIAPMEPIVVELSDTEKKDLIDKITPKMQTSPASEKESGNAPRTTIKVKPKKEKQ